MTRLFLAAALAAVNVAAAAPPAIRDADTKGWWATTRILASDAMEGRDTGSPAYERAGPVSATSWRTVSGA